MESKKRRSQRTGEKSGDTRELHAYEDPGKILRCTDGDTSRDARRVVAEEHGTRIWTRWTNQWRNLGLRISRPCLVEHTTYAGGDFPYAGTVDMHAPIEGWKAILDLKSSKQPYESHKLQLGAYARAMREHGIETNRGFVVYVRATGVELVELSAIGSAGSGARSSWS